MTETAGLDRTIALLRTRPIAPRTESGYLDLLDAEPQPARGIQALWVSGPGSRAYHQAQSLGRRFIANSRPQLDQLRLHEGAQVLDVGCGPGDITEDIGKRVGDAGLAVGLDVSQAMLEMAARRHAPNLAFVRADATGLPFDDAVFDAVNTVFVLQLIPDAAAVLAEMARVLRPGGRLCIVIPGNDLPSDHPVKALFGRLGKVTMFSAAELSELADAAGFTEIRGQSLGIAQTVAATKPR